MHGNGVIAPKIKRAMDDYASVIAVGTVRPLVSTLAREHVHTHRGALEEVACIRCARTSRGTCACACGCTARPPMSLDIIRNICFVNIVMELMIACLSV